MSKESNAYILGTDYEELQRLGLQHQIWASEAHTGWDIAKFTQGMNLLDLGCGPGFCTKELSYITGSDGSIIAIDKSETYIEHLKKIKELYDIQVTPICADFNQMELTPDSLDGGYCRWAMAWIPNPKEILSKVKIALKKGGKFVIHEYYDWSTHQAHPNMPNLNKAIAGCLQSFNESEGNIDIGRELPNIFEEIGMKVISIRPMTKLATPSDLKWHWPKSFYKSYLPRIAEMGYITPDEAELAWEECLELEKNPNSTIFCPYMVEVIAEKI